MITPLPRTIWNGIVWSPKSHFLCLTWYINILLAAAVVNSESLLAMVIAFEVANELNYIVILYIFVGICMTAHFWGRPDRWTGDGCWDTGVTRDRKYHRVGGDHHCSNGGCYLEKREFYTFMISRGWVIMTAMVMFPRKCKFFSFFKVCEKSGNATMITPGCGKVTMTAMVW